MSALDMDNRFAYHPAITQQRKDAHQAVRTWCLALAAHLDAELPDGREKALAITKLEESMFWANAAIARQPDPGILPL